MNIKTLIIILNVMIMSIIDLTIGFECFIGDGSTLRRKKCQSISTNMDIDTCYKKFGGVKKESKIIRGCFHSAIYELITSVNETGCHPIPEDYGGGIMCICDTDLCNSVPSIIKNNDLLLLSSSLAVLIIYYNSNYQNS